MGLRRRSRELALQFLFQNEFGVKGSFDTALRRFAEHFDVEADVVDYASLLVAGIQHRRAEVDSLIQSNSVHWKIARMALVDVNVMRIAIFEMAFMEPQVPPSVAINEAVDIAKRYGTTDSGGFVNGVLDNISKGLAR